MNVLVPVSPSRTNDATVAQAVERLRAADGTATVHLVYTTTVGHERPRTDRAEALLERSARIARDRGGDEIDVTTTTIGADRYLATPNDHAAALAAYAEDADIDRMILDPSYSVDATDRALQPLEDAFDRAGLAYDRATVTAAGWPTVPEVVRFWAVFGLAFVFTIVVTAPPDTFAVVTGIIGAGIAGILFRNVTFETTPRLASAVGVFARGLLIVPYLLGKILIANVQISYLVLHPSLPIDPHLDRVDTRLPGGLSVTGLANSLTLTPGTLTVDAERDELLVHSITEQTRREVLDGERIRAIQFAFFGRGRMEPAGQIDPDRVETVAGPRVVADLREGRGDD